MKRNIKDQQKGIAGFFLDVPVLLFVMIAITIFTAFFSQTYIRYQEESEIAEREEICLDIKRGLRGFPRILEESEDGVQRGRFSADKLDGLENETLESYLNVGDSHAYKVVIENTVGEDTWVFGNMDSDTGSADRESISSYQIPILLVAEAEQPVVGILRVMVW